MKTLNQWLLDSAKEPNFDLVKSALENGADINCHDIHNITPIASATRAFKLSLTHGNIKHSVFTPELRRNYIDIICHLLENQDPSCSLDNIYNNQDFKGRNFTARETLNIIIKDKDHKLTPEEKNRLEQARAKHAELEYVATQQTGWANNPSPASLTQVRVGWAIPQAHTQQQGQWNPIAHVERVAIQQPSWTKLVPPQPIVGFAPNPPAQQQAQGNSAIHVKQTAKKKVSWAKPVPPHPIGGFVTNDQENSTTPSAQQAVSAIPQAHTQQQGQWNPIARVERVANKQIELTDNVSPQTKRSFVARTESAAAHSAPSVQPDPQPNQSQKRTGYRWNPYSWANPKVECKFR